MLPGLIGDMLAGAGGGPCTFSGSFTLDGSPPVVVSGPYSITVPAGNTGDIQLKNQVETGAVVFEYSKNGGAYTNGEPNPTAIAMANGDTLTLRISGAGSGEQIAFDIYDVTFSSTIESVVISST